MAGRPRTPAKVLELSGAWDKNPQRRRVEPEGVGALNEIPPTTLPSECVPIWHELIARFPKIVITDSDRYGLEVLTMAMWELRKSFNNPKRFQQFCKAEQTVRHWLVQFGMTPAARAKLAVKVGTDKKNPFKDT